MAVKTWSAGEVLTAVDLNDTITNARSGRRNLIYNGAMQVAQRRASLSGITTGGYYTVDRFGLDISSIGTWTQSVEADAPTGSGFRKSLKMLCTTADGSPAASDILSITQPLEGQDLQIIKKGTASAEPLTLSFWVKSNVTGTYTVLVYDNDNNRATSFAYSVSASATWEQKTISIPADTTGALDNDTAASLTLFWCLGAGSDFTSGTLAAAWETYTAANRAVGQTNLAAATNNYWQITGVQLEVGDTATEFEHKTFAQEWLECLRYFETSNNYGSNIFTNNTAGEIPTNLYNNIGNSDYYWTVVFKVIKRTAPTVTTYPYTTATNTGRWSNDVGTDYAANSAAALVSERGFWVRNDSGGTLTVGGQQIILGNWIADAEI